jgi:hypothetical protein
MKNQDWRPENRFEREGTKTGLLSLQKARD